MNLVKCFHPEMVYNRYTHKLITVPCGRCSYCRSQKSLQWSNRLELECQKHRYTIFGTLTYTDDCLPTKSVDECVSVTSVKSIEKSIDYIESYAGYLPCALPKDFQDFMKRLRINLKRHYGIEKANLRYFCALEYGPTTFRPHFHYLLWFDDDRIAKNIKECVYTSWKSKNTLSSRRQWFRRNQTKFVLGYSCARYVAGYLNCLANVPPILLEKPFRTKHLQSINPSIGYGNLRKEQVYDIITGRVNTVSFVRPSNNRIVTIPLWRSFENRWLPKCLGYSSLTLSDRESLYSVYSSPRFGKDYYTFEFWVLREWFSTCSLSILLRSVIPSECCSENGELFNLCSLRSIWETSRTFHGICQLFSFTPKLLVGYIDAYYSRKEYTNLCVQLQSEIDWLEACPRDNYKLSYLPFLIDSQFYENLRSLSLETLNEYQTQFGCSRDFFDLPFFTTEYQSKKTFFDRLVDENTKTRRKKDYVSSHPEYGRFYTNLANLL